MSKTCPRCASQWCSGTAERRCIEIHLVRSFWYGCYTASYEITFDWAHWKAEGAGEFTGLRAAFRAFGPAMQCYGLTAEGIGPELKKTEMPSDDKVTEATKVRGAAMELD